MEESEYELLLADRIGVIKSANEKYDLEHNAYLSFSGGKDSTMLHYLIDLALPNNHIPRVFINTGIEYNDIVAFVKELASQDDRFVIWNSGINLRKMWEKDGYPFKSKYHSHDLEIWWNNKDKDEMPISIKKYLGIVEDPKKFKCPHILRYQFTKEFTLHCSDKCCYRLKKETAKRYQKESGRSIVLTGMRKDEGGQRLNIGCMAFTKDKELRFFHPLAVITKEWEEDFIERNGIKLCKLYYPPYNFKRTGCKGCPFALDLQHSLDVMEDLLPQEKQQCETLFKPVYDEYRRIGFRLRKQGESRQLSFNFEEEKTQ